MSWEDIADSHRAAKIDAMAFAAARRRAALLVIAHAQDKDDATSLMDALGLATEEGTVVPR